YPLRLPPLPLLFPYTTLFRSLASFSPSLANLVTQTPLGRELAKAAAGMAPQRRIPRFAPQSFKEWFRLRGPRNIGGSDVIVWPRSEEHTSELQSLRHLVCRLL